MADTKRAVGRGRDTRYLVRGCPRCRGTLERLAEQDAGSIADVSLALHQLRPQLQRGRIVSAVIAAESCGYK